MNFELTKEQREKLTDAYERSMKPQPKYLCVGGWTDAKTYVNAREVLGLYGLMGQEALCLLVDECDPPEKICGVDRDKLLRLSPRTDGDYSLSRRFEEQRAKQVATAAGYPVLGGDVDVEKWTRGLMGSIAKPGCMPQLIEGAVKILLDPEWNENACDEANAVYDSACLFLQRQFDADKPPEMPKFEAEWEALTAGLPKHGEAVKADPNDHRHPVGIDKQEADASGQWDDLREQAMALATADGPKTYLAGKLDNLFSATWNRGRVHAERRQIPADGESVEAEAHRALIGLQSDLIYRHGTSGGPPKYKEYVDNVVAALLRWHEGGKVIEREKHQGGRTYRKTALVELEPAGTGDVLADPIDNLFAFIVTHPLPATTDRERTIRRTIENALRDAHRLGWERAEAKATNEKATQVNVMADEPKVNLGSMAARLLIRLNLVALVPVRTAINEALQEAYDAGKGVRMEHTDDVACTLTEEALVDLTMERLHNILAWTDDGGTKIRRVIINMVKRSKGCAS